MASVADTSGGDSSQTVEEIEYFGAFTFFDNTWKITSITLDAEGYPKNAISTISSGMIGRTVKLTASDWKTSAGTETAKISTGTYDLLCMFRLSDGIILDVPLIPNGDTFYTNNASFNTMPDDTVSYCVIEPHNNGKTIKIYNMFNNQPEEPHTYSAITTMQAVY